MPTKLLIAVPAYRGQMHFSCTLSLLELSSWLARRGIAHTFRFLDGADIVLLRNIFSSAFLKGDCSHLLFVDSDMAFAPSTVIKMVDSGFPFVGAAYPSRGIDLPKLVESDAPMQTRRALAMEFAVFPLDETAPTIMGDFCHAIGIGMGLTLIARSVLENLVRSNRIRVQHDPPPKFALEGPLYGFFDQAVDNKGTMLAEDLSFCHRWRTHCRGAIMALISDEVGHMGEFQFRARYADRIATASR
jgi:hypothetical protein